MVSLEHAHREPRVDQVGLSEALELEAGLRRVAGHGQLHGVLGQSLTALGGDALECADHGHHAAPVLLREALAQLRMPQHVGPELEENRQPAVVVPAVPGRIRRSSPLVRRLPARERRLGLLHRRSTRRS